MRTLAPRPVFLPALGAEFGVSRRAGFAVSQCFPAGGANLRIGFFGKFQRHEGERP